MPMRVGSLRSIICALALFAASAGVTARASVNPPLFVIPVDPLPAGTTPLTGSAAWHLQLDSADAPKLASTLQGHAARLRADGRVEVDVGPYVAAISAARRDWIAPTFVIDFGDAPVPELSAKLRNEHPRPQPADVVAFVAATVTGSHDRGFDVASQVARNRSGDCTEFAVLTAALARAAGLPARVVLGVALLAGKDQFAAYGHAWAEIDGGSGWQVADAALASKDVEVRYLALGVLEDEGPGYMMSAAQPMSAWIRRVRVIAAD